MGRTRGYAGVSWRALVTVAGPMIQAQFVETMILLTINHQTLIATKANRITRAAEGRTVLEFGSRRAQATTALSSVPALPTSAAVRARPAFCPTVTTRFRPAARWRTPGCRCLTASTKPSRLMQIFIRITAYSWLTLIMYSSPVCRTQSALPRNWRRRRASAHAASVWIPAISLTFLSSPQNARCRRL